MVFGLREIFIMMMIERLKNVDMEVAICSLSLSKTILEL